MLISFEFDDTSLRAVVGQFPNRQFRVTGTVELPFEEDSEALGLKLKEKLRELGVQKADAIAVLSRWQSEIREVTVPPVPDNELPDLVRFQARNEFISLTDDWKLDYIRLDQPTEGPHRVLAAAVSPTMSDRLQSICQAAGINLKHIVLQPLAILDLFTDKHENDNAHPRLMIRSSADRADLSIAAGSNLKVTRSIRFAPDATPEKRASMLISESRRTLASASSIFKDPIKHAIVLGPEKRFKALGGDLTKGLGFTVEFVDAFTTVPLAANFEPPEQTAEFAALVGALARQESGAKHAIDFLSPKRVVVRRPERSRWLTIAGLALAASALLFLFGWFSLRSQQQTIDGLNQTLTRAMGNNKGDRTRPGVDQIIGEVDIIDQWKLNDINWLYELKQISERMLTPDDVIVDSLTASAGQKSPRLDLNSRFKSISKETELIGSLSGRPYQVETKRSVADETDKDYPLGFDLQASLQPDLASLLQQINQQAAEFLQQQQNQAVLPEEPQ